MALNRTAPSCKSCGKEAEGVYLDQSDTPLMQRIIGDTFQYWKEVDCKCENRDLINMANEIFKHSITLGKEDLKNMNEFADNIIPKTKPNRK